MGCNVRPVLILFLANAPWKLQDITKTLWALALHYEGITNPLMDGDSSSLLCSRRSGSVFLAVPSRVIALTILFQVSQYLMCFIKPQLLEAYD